jgi:hypothetical protein
MTSSRENQTEVGEGLAPVILHPPGILLTNLDLNSRLNGEKPVTNCLSYGTALDK